MIYAYIYNFFDYLFTGAQLNSGVTLDKYYETVLHQSINLQVWLCHTLSIISIILIFLFFIKFIIWLFKLFGGLFKW